MSACHQAGAIAVGVGEGFAAEPCHVPSHTALSAKPKASCDGVWKAVQAGLCRIGNDRPQARMNVVDGSGWAAQRRRWRFAEQGAVFDREAAELPEAMHGRDFGDGADRGIGVQQGAARQVHPPQPEIADGSDAEDVPGSRCEAFARTRRRRRRSRRGRPARVGRAARNSSKRAITLPCDPPSRFASSGW